MKEKKRFLVYEIISKNKFDFDSVKNVLEQECLNFLGTDGMNNAGINFLKWNGNMGIIRVNPKFVDKLKTSLALTKKIQNKDVIVRSIGVSGIIKKAEEKFMAS